VSRAVSKSQHENFARQDFDRWAESHTFRRLGPWLQFVQRRILGMVDWTETTRVLDVACGSGAAVYLSAERLANIPSGIACGCDISKGMLEKRARSATHINAHFVVASAQALPYRDGIFDAVFCTAAFHHFLEPVNALREFIRVLSNNGVVIITDTCRDQSLLTWIWDRLHRWFEKGHVMYYRRDELSALLDEAGFADVALEEFSPSYRETKKLASSVAIFRARREPSDRSAMLAHASPASNTQE
jgi:ubiquinone/menaquinone biosynthesis C-methylase UbiE